MNIQTDIRLGDYLTMKIGGPATHFTDVATLDELTEALQFARDNSLPYFVIGGGSNVIARDETYNGLIIHNQLKGIEVIKDTPQTTTFKVAAGEHWDDFVKMSVEQNLTGIEAMSAIPGTVGAAPVQNVGAYGQEIADTLQSLEAYDTHTKQLVTLTNEQCEFGYRHSIFRGNAFGRYVITSVTLTLYKSAPQPPFYAALQKQLDEANVSTYTPQIIRDVVTAIRASKLPDPAIKPNSGSFFKNAMIESWQLSDLLAKNTDAPHYTMPDGRYKIPTGWLIEHAGLKGSLISGMRVNPANALVLINESASGYSDLATARNEIITAVRDIYQITIEQEPLEIRP